MMPRVVKSWLIPWEPGIPGIAYQYADGFVGCSDARSKDSEVLIAIAALSPTERDKLAKQLEESRALDRAER